VDHEAIGRRFQAQRMGVLRLAGLAVEQHAREPRGGGRRPLDVGRLERRIAARLNDVSARADRHDLAGRSRLRRAEVGRSEQARQESDRQQSGGHESSCVLHEGSLIMGSR
jgi:hypothetical protein